MESFDDPVLERYGRSPRWPLYTIAAILLVATVVSSAYLYRQRQQTRELAATNQNLSASLVQLQNQLVVLNQRMDELRTPITPVAVVSRSQAAKARPARVSQAPTPRPPRDDPRFKEIQGRLSDQQEQLASTRDDLN